MRDTASRGIGPPIRLRCAIGRVAGHLRVVSDPFGALLTQCKDELDPSYRRPPLWAEGVAQTIPSLDFLCVCDKVTILG